MRVFLQRWPGPIGRYSADNGFGWHHLHVLPNLVLTWKRKGR
jgi:hypothetical protein